jgi:Icc-related predicted phosphoesterase
MDRYGKLFKAVSRERPEAVFLGGDILPSFWKGPGFPEAWPPDFVNGFLVKNLNALRVELGGSYPRLFVIMGNDDQRLNEASVLDAAVRGVWEYIHNRRVVFKDYLVFGYAFIPPTPFRLKDWERYDVSRYTDPGAVSPEEGYYSVPVAEREKKYATIQDDLDRLAEDSDLAKAIFLFHSPPYQTRLDASSLKGKMIDHVPLDRHLGSIAIRRFIERRQPLLTLHGHVHEAAKVSLSWQDCLGRTHCFSAAHDGPELALVRFDPERLDEAERRLL